MSAVVMSNYYFPPSGQRFVADGRYPVQNWMLAHMAQYPPPPQPDQQHYNALYPTTAGAQDLLVQDQLQYSNLNQAVYPKIESATGEQVSSNQQLRSLSQQFHQHTPFDNRHIEQNIHLSAQQIPQQAVHGQQGALSHKSQPSSHRGTPEQAPKSSRLRKACDSCSIRKVKCDETGPPCSKCAELDIPCTFHRPSRRRGPPNRHAEAVKRRRLEDATTESSHVSGSPPSSPTHAAQALAALSSYPSNQPLSAESICSFQMLEPLIDEFFVCIHPLYPFPHEPSFREAWKQRADLKSPSFLALLASMIGALVSSFPRKFRLDLKTSQRHKPLTDHTGLINRCQKVCALARGPGYLGSDDLTVHDAATSFFVALTSLHMLKWRQARMYLVESLTIVRNYGLQKEDSPRQSLRREVPTSSAPSHPNYDGHLVPRTDIVTIDLARRIFWSIFVALRNMQQLGTASDEVVIAPPTPSDPLPPFPAEVDDFRIRPTYIEPQPSGQVPVISGFNTNAKIYCSSNSIAAMEVAGSFDAAMGWDRERVILREALRSCKDAMSGMAANFAQPRIPRDSISLLDGNLGSNDGNKDPEQRRRIQREIQQANIMASGLLTRSHIINHYWKRREAHEQQKPSKSGSASRPPGSGIGAPSSDATTSKGAPRNRDPVEQEMRQERENVVRDLLSALGSITEVNMEPNADNFTTKLRHLAHVLLDLPDSRKSQLLLDVREPLSAFLDDLTMLERVALPNSDGEEGDRDVDYKSIWTNLRQCQARLLQSSRKAQEP